MPLPTPAPRKCLHTRRVICEGYERDDGLWDIEARLQDSKTYGFDNRYRGRIEAGELIHGMVIRVTLDIDFVIHQAVAAAEDTPYGACQTTGEVMSELVGLKIAPGWMRKVRSRIAANKSCTHLIELLGPLATTAFQTMYRAIEEKALLSNNPGRPKLLDSCLALASDGAVAKNKWPEFYTGNPRVDLD